MEHAMTSTAPGAEGASIRLVVVDDHALFRRGIGQLLSMYGDIQVVAEAASGAEGIEAVLTHRPDVALVDLHMKGLDGISVIRALQSAGSTTRLVMLTVSDSSFDVMEALKAGASGYLLKDMEPDEFCLKLRQVAAGGTVLSSEVGGLLAKPQPPPGKASTKAGPPSPPGSRKPWSWCPRAPPTRSSPARWASPKAR